jgi:hypothetical protein
MVIPMQEHDGETDVTITVRMDRELAADLQGIASERHQDIGEIVLLFSREGVVRHQGNVCRVCSTHNSPGARFCQECGRALFAEGERMIVEGLRDARDSPEYQYLLQILRRDLGLK